jgi:phage tail-like protein
MSILAEHRELFGRWKFLVDDVTSGLPNGRFKSGSGLKYNVGKVEYREGGALAAQKEPGLVTFDDFTLERGMSRDEYFYNWLVEVVDMLRYQGGGGDISPRFKRDLNVRQLERNNTTVINHDVRQGFPIEWSGGEWDADAEEVTVDMAVITYYYFTREVEGQTAVA